ncbi:MAG: 2-oxo-hepta-3-ene-1,7-dioic acid hydratase, partial [Paracoccaceae bacterium]|nr:2-oxo-hepta-3-ene-1,7-dioic acid hydratase [Paracoccaceae bacterium]
MLTSTQIEKAALDLFEAEKTKRQIDLLSNRHPGLTLDESYAIQDALVDLKLKDGRKQIGWKIGLTSRAMQMA